MQRGLRTIRSAPGSLRAQFLHSSATVPNPSHVLNKTGSSYKNMTVDNLRLECRKRGLKVSGNKSNLLDRLSIDDSSASFSTVVKAPKRKQLAPPVPAVPAMPTMPKNMSIMANVKTPVKTVKAAKQDFASTVMSAARTIQTASATGAKNDESTIDYFKLPELETAPVESDASVPVMPTNYTTKTIIPDAAPIAKPEITHVSGDIEVLPIQDGVEPDDGQYFPSDEQIPSRDKMVLTSIVAGTIAWWGLGSMIFNDE
ncbi:hypothetical protein V1512DRAFT_261094 [Lipomyces arxii]|uniref:uncharacterized protein n=1 Tax=Lipomyces arxii TaxID=56418 RepID=UPI0034CE8134